jgi:hypothetical protein
MTTTINNLPSDIIQIIAKKTDNESLINFSLVSKKIYNDIFEDNLYNDDFSRYILNPFGTLKYIEAVKNLIPDSIINDCQIDSTIKFWRNTECLNKYFEKSVRKYGFYSFLIVNKYKLTHCEKEILNNKFKYFIQRVITCIYLMFEINNGHLKSFDEFYKKFQMYFDSFDELEDVESDERLDDFYSSLNDYFNMKVYIRKFKETGFEITESDKFITDMAFDELGDLVFQLTAYFEETLEEYN